MQHAKPTCAAALAALLMSVGPALAPAAAEAGDHAAAAAEGHDHGAHHGHDHGHADSHGEAASGDGFANDVQRVSYALGVNIAQSFKQPGQEIELDMAVLSEALQASYAGGELRLSADESLVVLQGLSRKMVERQKAQAAEAGAENRAAGAAFLAENGAREGVVTTESGLQVEIIEQGEGETPGPDDTVELHYKGTLLSGETFDSSYQRGRPAKFPVSGVVPGFAEGLQLLPVGTKAKLFIPAGLAYGDSAQSPGGPGNMLTFEVEILGIEVAPGELSLAEQIEQAQAQLADDIDRVREEGERRIEHLQEQLKSELEASGGSSATVGGDAAAEPKKVPQYD